MRRGNILLTTFVLLTALAIIVGSITFLHTTNVRNVGFSAKRLKALYLAEAGLQKATWYLRTPTLFGGFGYTWRTSGTTESFSGGSFTLRIANTTDPNTLLITAEGTAGGITRKIQALYQKYGAASFKYATFSQQLLTIEHRVTINGSVFVNGNVVARDSQITGEIIVTSPNTIRINGVYLTGTPVPVPAPVYPGWDQTYYNALLSTAASSAYYDYAPPYYPGGGTLNLFGATINARRDIYLSGTINGPGTLVANDDIFIQDNCTIGDNITFVCGDQLQIGHNTTLGNGLVFYGGYSLDTGSNVTTAANNRVSLLTPNYLGIGASNTINGIIYAGNYTVYNSSRINGSLFGGSVGFDNNFEDDSRVYFNKDSLPDLPPYGVKDSYVIVKGSWKEL